MILKNRITIIASLVMAQCFLAGAIFMRIEARDRAEVLPVKKGKIGLVRKTKGISLTPIVSKRFQDDSITVDVHSQGFGQGDVLYIEIYSNDDEAELRVKRIIYDTRGILFSRRGWGYRALIGMHPDTKPGRKNIEIEYAAGKVSKKFIMHISVNKSQFKYYPHPLDLGKYSDVDYQLKPEIIEFIQRCSEKKQKVFSHISDDMLGAQFSHPRDYHFITSPFWAKRLVMRYRKKGKKKVLLRNKVNIHRGVDFRGNTGEPVYAIADGIIVLAEEMYYEGNFIVIDHGNRIFSYYMHLSKFKVKSGDRVKAGDLIGLVGTSGISTASHLHLSLMIQGVQVNPLSLLSLPVRE